MIRQPKQPCRCGGTGWDDTDPMDPRPCPNPMHEDERKARLRAAEREREAS